MKKSAGKSTGAYYTPKNLVNFMVNHVYNRESGNIQHVLEPSVGKRAFLDVLSQYDSNIEVVDINSQDIKEIDELHYPNVHSYNVDYLEYVYRCEKKYDLIIGNPPYIRIKNLSLESRDASKKIVRDFDLPDSISQNIWVSFILGSVKLLSENGTIFFVLPFEFLQVQYPQSLRIFLETIFPHIEIFTFEITPFPNIEQDVCLIYLSKNSKTRPEIDYTTFHSIEDFKICYESKIIRNKPVEKWSNAILSDDDVDLVNQFSNRHISINDIGSTSPGIVTAGNNYFIINNSTLEKLKCSNFVLRIIRKSAYFLNMLIPNETDLCKLNEKDEPIWLLNLHGHYEEEFPTELNKYLSSSESYVTTIKNGYKCRHRTKWYWVPIIPPGDLLFFKRYDQIPRLVVNALQVHTTDIAYNMRINREIYDPLSVAFCFYNSLTMLCCEINGRFYGGGVAELTPSEFKKLPLPYKKIPLEKIHTLDELFRNGNSIDEIINYVDDVVLTTIKSEDMIKLKELRKRYLDRRIFKRNS